MMPAATLAGRAAITTAVLLPGNMCDARLWSGGGSMVAAVLAARGFGAAHAGMLDQSTIADMAAAVLARVPGRLLPIGFSMGGIVALEMTRQAPERIAGLVLVDTNAGADLPERSAVRPVQQARVRAGALPTIVADELKPTYLAAANRGDTALKDLLFDMAMGLGDDVFCAQSEALRTRADLGPVLDGFADPVLFAVGAEDALCPPDWHAAMAARCARATLRVIDGAGHMLPLERPHELAAAIGRWLDDIGEMP
ncbi:alpha/beta fold hydrolase [Glacieibacterium frigidum]|nr:alpha/beta hydrolase [Glacieibacterium frigidum]